MEFRLEIIDYVLIVTALVSSSAVGLYYGFVKKKNNSVEEYFLASRESSAFTVACSLFATVVSSGSMIGIVAETYYYGFQPAVGFFVLIPAQYIFIKLFFPVFYKIGNQDFYTYYELRFLKQIRYFLAFMTVIEKALGNCVIIYGTATVLNSVSGIHTWILNCIMTAICLLYTSLGGVRGVTIADTVQAFVIVGSVIAILVLGFIHVGGVSVVWDRNWQSGRLSIFNFSFDMYTRYTFWSITIGSLFTYVSSLSTSTTYVLRLMSSGSIEDAHRSGRNGVATAVAVNFCCAVIAALIYAVYYLCDPILSGAIRNPNQLISVLIGDRLMTFTGLAGIFFAGFVCAAVSTLSSALNGTAALIMETFVKPLNVVHSDVAYTTVAKIIVVLHGVLSLLGIVIVEQFPNVYQAMMTIQSILNGPQLGLICIGMFFPQANLKSSIGGFISGMVFMFWVVVGTLVIKPSNIKMPVSTSGCPSFATNVTKTVVSNWTLYENSTAELGLISFTNSSAVTSKPPAINPWASYFPLSSISYTWFTLIGLSFTFTLFVILSLIFGPEKQHPCDLDLIPAPVQNVQKKLSRGWQKRLLCDVYSSDIRADQEMTAIQSARLMVNGDAPPSTEKVSPYT